MGESDIAAADGFREAPAEAAYPRLLTLPLFPGMGDEEIEAVIAGIRKVLRYYSLSR